jgi:hypothetical protein
MSCWRFVRVFVFSLSGRVYLEQGEGGFGFCCWAGVCRAFLCGLGWPFRWHAEYIGVHARRWEAVPPPPPPPSFPSPPTPQISGGDDALPGEWRFFVIVAWLILGFLVSSFYSFLWDLWMHLRGIAAQGVIIFIFISWPVTTAQGLHSASSMKINIVVAFHSMYFSRPT